MFVREMSDGAMGEVANPHGIVCCSPSWGASSRFVYFSNGSGEGPIPAGLWQYDSVTGETFEIGGPTQYFRELANLTQFAFLPAPQSVQQPEYILHEITGAGPRQLREDQYFGIDPLWDPNGLGVLIVDLATANINQMVNNRPGGTLRWLPADGSEAVELVAIGNNPKWAVSGEANMPPTPVPVSEAEAAAEGSDAPAIPGLVIGPDGWPVGGVSVDAGSNGSISGSIAYPSEGIPKMKIYAVGYNAAEEFRYYWIGTATNQQQYTLEVESGMYYVYAYGIILLTNQVD